jgi:hypothetical protein
MVELPTTYRVAIKMIEIVLWLFAKDVRLTALVTVLCSELETVPEELRHIQIDAVADYMKQQCH